MLFKDDKPLTSKEEALERRVRPPPEKYDPDTRSHWSITMMVAWIIWGEIDAVRHEWDDYRNACADWRFESDPRARVRAERIAIDNITGQTSDPDLEKGLRKNLKKGSWHFHQWKPSGWKGLCSRARSENRPPQDAIDLLWLEAGEGRTKATAIECENAKAFDGDRIEIPAHRWPHLKRVDDPLTGKAMLSDDQGRVYREVQFPRLDAKQLWPETPPLPGEPLDHVEKPEPEQTRAAESKSQKDWLHDTRRANPQGKNELPGAYAGRLHLLMEKAHAAKRVTKLWPLKTLLRRLYDK